MKTYEYDEINTISSFTFEYRFLSNFYPCKIHFDKMEYPSVEHAYQASKTEDLSIRSKIKDLSAGQAKRLGKTFPKLPDDYREYRMKTLVGQKFIWNETLAIKLIGTEPKILIEGNNWGDKFFGCVLEDGKWVGENKLGEILMMIRNTVKWIYSENEV